MICLLHTNTDNRHFSLLQLVSSLVILILQSSGGSFIVLSGCDVLLLAYNELRAQLIYYLIIIIVSPFYLCFFLFYVYSLCYVYSLSSSKLSLITNYCSIIHLFIFIRNFALFISNTFFLVRSKIFPLFNGLIYLPLRFVIDHIRFIEKQKRRRRRWWPNIIFQFMNEFSRFTDRLHSRNDGKQRKHDSFLTQSDITINNGQISSSVNQFCFVYVINEWPFFSSFREK